MEGDGDLCRDFVPCERKQSVPVVVVGVGRRRCWWWFCREDEGREERGMRFDIFFCLKEGLVCCNSDILLVSYCCLNLWYT